MRELEEVCHPAGSATELDDVATLHGGRGDLDGGYQRTAGCPAAHRSTSTGVDRSGAE
ncbi:hypothetical protein [Streptomyces barringtoniae]|uniref:hypothetical protein n=1 Tax=Streptomyces barringtoniae TaxID=2892029 RepID=UPI001E54345E|nr:hypothetical protein [Streptomyces barringtoniae]MCC5480346.1 hypothetical protein [Streptomyces barringtoniae]